MGTIYSSRRKREDFFRTPIEISQNAIDTLSRCAEKGSDAEIYNRLQRNEQMWLNKYAQLEQTYNTKREIVDKETFNSLYNSLYTYLGNEQYREGENLKNKVIECYFYRRTQTLECSTAVNRFNRWLDETRTVIAKENY